MNSPLAIVVSSRVLAEARAIAMAAREAWHRRRWFSVYIDDTRISPEERATFMRVGARLYGEVD